MKFAYDTKLDEIAHILGDNKIPQRILNLSAVNSQREWDQAYKMVRTVAL